MKPLRNSRAYAGHSIRVVRVFAIGGVLALAAGLTACGGEEQSVVRPTGSPPALVAVDAMRASAERFQTQINSLQGTMDIFEAVNGKSFDIKGDMTFKAPNKMHMKMDMGKLGDFEVLLLGSDYYLGHDGTWAHMDLSSVATDPFAKYAHNKGPVSYADVVKRLQRLHQLPNENLDGKSYWHYQGDVDAAEALKEMPQDAQTQAEADVAKDICSSSVDILLDPDTLLPRRYVMDMGMRLKGDTISVLMTMEFQKYNSDVDIPAAPQSATEVPVPSLTPRSTTVSSAGSSPDLTAAPCDIVTPTPMTTATPEELAAPTPH